MAHFEHLKLIAITNDAWADAELIARSAALLAAARPGSVALDLRSHSRQGARLLALGERLVALARAHEQRFLVNDRVDLALILGADGLHLGEGSVSARAARELMPSIWAVAACHSVEAVERVDADALLLSPVLEARKSNPALGLGALGAARARLGAHPRKRLYALGGIDAERAASCLAAGADGVAAIGSVFGEVDFAPLLRALGIARS